MGWGSSQHTVGTNSSTGNNSYSNTQTPDLPAWLQGAFQNTVGAGQGLLAKASQPVYGEAQTANYLQQQNQLADNAQKQLSAQLAAKGIGNSGAASQGYTDILQSKMGNESNFLGQLPFLNQQASIQNMNAAIAGATSANRAVPIGSTSTGTGAQSGEQTQNSTTTQSMGIGQLLGSLGGAALGGLTGGLGGATGGLKGGGSAIPYAAGGAPIQDPGMYGEGQINPGYGQMTGPSAPPTSSWGNYSLQQDPYQLPFGVNYGNL